MPTAEEFFTTLLPNKLAKDPAIRATRKVFQFDIADVGTWTLDLIAGTVSEGAPEAPADCVVAYDRASWEQLLDNPAVAMQLVMMKKLTVSNLSLGTRLQQILK